MESLGYVLINLLRGDLPWQGLTGCQLSEIGRMKDTIKLEHLCAGLPVEFMLYLNYCRRLRFDQRPDYDYLKRMFRLLARFQSCHGSVDCGQFGGQITVKFDWVPLMEADKTMRKRSGKKKATVQCEIN